MKVTQVDRLKVEGFLGQIMRDHTKLWALEPADEAAVLVYRMTAGFPREELYGLTSTRYD